MGTALLSDSMTRLWRSLFAVAMILSLIGCGSQENNSKSASQSSENISGASAAIDPATTGSIKGTVRLVGAPPPLKAIDMSAAPACVKANAAPVIPPQVVIGDGGALAEVAVYVKSGLGNRHFDAPQNSVILEQKACMYEPHVIALMVNQKLEVRNDDSTTHNVHLLAKTNQPWNKSQPLGGPAIEETFAKPELAIPVACNVHPWMRAFAFVFDNPYYEITSNSGAFELRNLPPGSYTIEAWQERYGTQEQTVTVGPKESKVISFTFNASNSASADSAVARQ